MVTPSQPPRIAQQLAMMLAVVGMAWPQPNEPALHQQNRNPRQIAPLTLVYGQQPRPSGPLSVTEIAKIRSWWPETNEPRLQFNQQQPENRRYIAPLTLVYGQQPRPSGPLTPTEINKLVRSWDQPWLASQSEPFSAPLAPPPPVQSDQPFNQTPYAQIASWQAIDWRIPPADGNSASWLAHQFVADRPEVPSQVHQSWRTELPPIQCSESIAPSISIAADQPPVVGSITPAEMSGIRLAWEPVRPEPPRPVSVAPLTLVYGQSPPIDGPLSEIEIQILVGQSPALWWPAQSECDNAGWNVPVVSSYNPVGPLLPQHWTAITAPRESWSAQSESDSAGWNVPVVSPFTPSAKQRPQLLASWQEPWRRENARVYMAPLIVPAVTTTVSGKYKPEHDSALVDVGNSTGFQSEHGSALKDVGDAGV